MSLVFRDSEKKTGMFSNIPVNRYFILKDNHSIIYKKLSERNFLKITMNPFNVCMISNALENLGTMQLEEIEMCEATIYAKHLYKDS